MPINISVIVTTKNEEAVIEDFLKSVKSQSYKQWEVIVVDNNSTDKTKELSLKYTQKVFNRGPERSSQRNYGVEKASGRYVLVLDADMQLEKDVLRECVEQLESHDQIGALIIPERSFGIGFWSACKAFEREFYVGDESIEAARCFRKELFIKFKGYDASITGPEDFELPLRMRKAGVLIGRIDSYILHNEKRLSLWRTMKKKFYYASHASVYLKRHPDMTMSQGNLLFRPAFIRGWKKLLRHPILALGMLTMRSLEMAAAGCGLIYGLVGTKKNG